MQRIYLIFLLISISFLSRGQRGWKTIKPVPDTTLLSELRIMHWDCTGCGDAEVDSGYIKTFDSSSNQMKETYVSTIFFSGNDTFEKIFRSYKSKRFGYTYLVRGKVVGLKPATKAHDNVSLFDVYQYKLYRKGQDFDFGDREPELGLTWTNVDSLFGPLPSSVHIYFTDDKIDTAAFRAYYLVADLNDKELEFTVDTAKDRRLTPTKFYERNDKPLAVVNCTFFSFATNRNLNTVVKNGKLVGYNLHTVNGRGKDTFTYRHTLASAIGISKDRQIDIAWTFTDSVHRYAFASQQEYYPLTDSIRYHSYASMKKETNRRDIEFTSLLKKWKMQTAVGGGPVLLQEGEIKITNDEEMKFAGRAIDDKHPRTAMGYTQDNKLIILMIEGRNKNAGGATLPQLAQIFKDLGCWEALNLDGGGSSCLLVNGKETIRVSDAAGQRPVPAVFLIKSSD